MFAAMNPSGPAAQSLRTRSGFSLPFLSVAGPVHGRPFFSAAVAQLAEHGSSTSVVAGSTPVGRSIHSQLSKSSSQASTSAARVKQRTSSAWTAASAHSSSFIKSSLRFVRDDSIFFQTH